MNLLVIVSKEESKRSDWSIKDRKDGGMLSRAETRTTCAHLMIFLSFANDVWFYVQHTSKRRNGWVLKILIVEKRGTNVANQLVLS